MSGFAFLIIIVMIAIVIELFTQRFLRKNNIISEKNITILELSEGEYVAILSSGNETAFLKLKNNYFTVSYPDEHGDIIFYKYMGEYQLEEWEINALMEEAKKAIVKQYNSELC